MKESDLQIQCVDYLTALAMRYNDLLFFSIPNEGLMFVLMSFGISKVIASRIVNFFKKMGMLSGIPDFQILFRGRMFFIEFKQSGKKPNEKQLRIHDKIRHSGFEVYVIDNFEDFKKIIESEGIR